MSMIAGCLFSEPTATEMSDRRTLKVPASSVCPTLMMPYFASLASFIWPPERTDVELFSMLPDGLVMELIIHSEPMNFTFTLCLSVLEFDPEPQEVQSSVVL